MTPSALQTMMPISVFLWIFQLDEAAFKVLELFAVSHAPMLVKTIGVLFRQQAKYLSRPMVANLQLLSGQSSRNDVACWSWSVWCQLSVIAKYLVVQPVHEWPSLSFLPNCWSCSTPTEQECRACKNFMEARGMKPVPTCGACELCHACAQDRHCGRAPRSSEDSLRFSFRFRCAAVAGTRL